MPILMRIGLKDMLHDHHNAIPSEEADLIEHRAGTILDDSWRISWASDK
jgi:hypothetical protein